MNSRPLAVRWRLPVLAAGAFCRLTGLDAALLLLDLPVPAPHAPLEQVEMVFPSPATTPSSATSWSTPNAALVASSR